ncbi:D-glucuronyl C5-epimerase family protein, partial [Vibrio sp. Isolate31]|uniref:D-glucuronyl C5-epimerase family protein n=1 Tax=Vibrio sp. Isolate31 TaxID=2908537 RepID=UPI001EFD5179
MIFSHGKFTTILQYFTGNYDDYWHILYPKVDASEREKDTYLYLYDISRKAFDYLGEFSAEGIYYFKGYDGKMHIHALELSQYSLACWLAWRKTSCISWVELAIKHCEWLVENQKENGSWLIEHKNPLYKDLPSPWPSGMAQGLAISSLVRAFKYTND